MQALIVHPSICLSIYVYLSIYLSVYPSGCLISLENSNPPARQTPRHQEISPYDLQGPIWGCFC